MPGEQAIERYGSLDELAGRFRSILGDKRFILLYAYNGTGKTRLSMAFKELGKTGEERDTLYYNAYTEDLFSWDNDLLDDSERKLTINSESRFIQGVRDAAINLEERIGKYLERYASFNFRIDYEQWFVSFYREDEDYIKISRGEENLFVWCLFLAICEMAIGGDPAYAWVKYIYIDDPISSLDDNNAIMVASDLARLLVDERNEKKVILSTHHGLFFNVLWNELHSAKHRSFFLCHDALASSYRLQDAGDTPFFNHVAMVSEFKRAADSGEIYTYHFNILRNVLERTASFFGYRDFSRCIVGIDDEVLFARAINLLSHGNYSVFEPREMVQDTKDLFNRILQGFLSRYEFNLPEIFAPDPEGVLQP
jgi:wobble nucleotide-excising tRNase